MKFTENGPTIPDDLLIARDAGDVIFFCGAGVSMAYAGLPDFFTLSDTVLNSLGAGRKSTARQLLDQARGMRTIGGVGGLIPADRIFSLLEREFEISDIRDEVIKSVRPTGVPSLDAHQILLDLSTSRSGKVRLVTTNFDLLFEACNAELPSFGPPDFLDPKAINFGGIIHLHGRAARDYDGPRASEEFVVSSADFGRAYLADGWATQFMRALLERFVVVFVGYTADDPPMRYLLEALNTHPGGRSQLYAFQSGTDQDTLAMWEHRGVRAISYDAPNHDHGALWDTLAAWAVRARDVDGWHEQLLQQAAQGPDKVGAYIRGQIAHLISTPEGARRIAATDPPLPASWLLVADSRQRYRMPEHEEFGNKDSLKFDPFEQLRLDTDAPPKAPDSNSAYSYRDREIPFGAWDGFANNKHDIGTTAGSLRGHNTVAPADLSPRLQHLSGWLSKVAHDPITLWWSAQQKNGLHPSVVERIRNRLLHDREKAFPEEIRCGWRLLMEGWSDLRSHPDMTAVLLGWQTKREGWSTRIVREYAALFCPRIEIDTRSWWRLRHPLLWTTGTSVERIVSARVEYPHPHTELDIPDELVGYAARLFRANLELSERLERETAHNQFYITTTYAYKDGGSRGSDAHGLAGLISYLLRLMEQFGRVDPDGAKAEISYWQGYDNRIFARLRLWAASSDLTTRTEAANILMNLPDDIFWYSQDSPDVLHAIVSSWPKLDVSERRQIEQRLLTTSFPWSGDIEEPHGYSAYRRLEYLHALSAAGVGFSFNLAALTEELCKLAPDWHPGTAEDAMASNAPKVQSVIENTDCAPLLDIPVSRILAVATEIAAHHPLSRWESASFKGLSEEKPARALSALRHAAGQGSIPDWAWQNFLWCPIRESDSLRLARATGHILCGLESIKLANIAYSVANWMCLLKKRLYGDLSALLDPLWNMILSALQENFPDQSTQSSGDWADVALNSPVGRLVDILFADPSLPNPADGAGLPDAWKQRADQLLALSGGMRCQALVMLSHHFVYLYATDSQWVDAQLVPFANSRTEAADALWEGLLWGARIPSPDLFRQLKPSLLVQARNNTREGQRAGNIAGLLLHGWAFEADDASGARLISDEEFREALIDANDDVRRGVLHYLKDRQERRPEQWHNLALSFFQKVWPRQRALKTAPLSKALLRFALSSGELFPNIVSLLESRLVPLRDGGGWLFEFNAEGENSPAKRYPRESLELLWAVLPDDASQWWFEIDKILLVLESSSDTRGDPRLSEIRRRLER